VFAASAFGVVNELSDGGRHLYSLAGGGTLFRLGNCSCRRQIFTPGGRPMTGVHIYSLFDGVTIFLGFSFILLVAVLIVTFGEQIRMRP
jgi:hypothetical protein